MSIMAPISAGDLFDRITILTIKCHALTDPVALKNVNRELDALLKIECELVRDHPTGYYLNEVSDLTRINNHLWHLEDNIRLIINACALEIRPLDECAQSVVRTLAETSLKIRRYNDERAAVKRKLNILFASEIVEEKSHKLPDLS